ncbi:hypothetical protein ACM41_26425 [Bradyrhizobium sp. CCBAU 21362]|uniref:hypothetical protein n=1 Tax=Bradyrhizobium sp. CCBAU 21362 TaxID=1325082 RepID=UPI002306075E|nr:hypothetical protein [Bradyrhizobium sp. CCBAU 21362]MDA9539639.1 hypothetical protein [Bradyrhizobium sp. CCBAU 21362]
MSDDFASIDACLDGAFAAVDGAQAAIAEEIDHGVLPPNALSTQGIWELAKEQKEREKAAKAEKAKAEKAERAKDGGEEKPERDGRRAWANKQANKGEQQQGLDDALDKAFKKAPEAAQKRKDDRAAEVKGEKPKPLSTKDFGGTREHRRSIKALFPGEKLSQVLAMAEKWDGELRKAPTLETVEKLAAEILKLPRTAKGKEKAEAGDGRTKALDRATEDAGDHEDLTAFVDKYGDRLPGILERLSVWLPELKEDPQGAGARLLASIPGVLDAPKAQPQPQQQTVQQDDLSPPATPQEDRERVSLGLQKAIEHNILPGLKNDQIAYAVAEVLTHMPRTNDRFADLRTAYAIVVQGTAAPAAAKSDKDQKGSKSIKGAPSAPSSARRAKGGSKGMDDALNRAFGGI